MKALGFWIRTAFDSDFIHPWEVSGQMSPELVSAVASYLRTGVLHEQYRGYSWCRFCCGIPDHQMGSRDLTDGIWVWPEGLAHYVEVHRVGLPDEFVLHALRGADGPGLADDAIVDFSAWITWCKSRRNSKYCEILNSARAEADAKAQVEVTELSLVIETTQGVSDELCAWAGCPRRAVKGMRICARHSIDRGIAGMRSSRVPDPPEDA
jgi:hypothetical protein